MKRLLPVLLALGLSAGSPAALAADECVALLHGLWRTENSMNSMAEALTAAGYTVVNVAYDSTDHPIDELANDLSQLSDGRVLIGHGLRASQLPTGRIVQRERTATGKTGIRPPNGTSGLAADTRSRYR